MIPAGIISSLTTKKIGADAIVVSYNMSQAVDARDAMCKRVYSELFQYMVTTALSEYCHHHHHH